MQIILDETHGYGVGTAIETTGNEGIINRTMDVLQKAGTCVFVGMIEGGLNIEKYMDRVGTGTDIDRDFRPQNL